MAEGRQIDAWNHTSSILAWIGNNNPHRKKGKTYYPREFHPFSLRAPKQQPPPIKADISILKKVFVDQRHKRRS